MKNLKPGQSVVYKFTPSPGKVKSPFIKHPYDGQIVVIRSRNPENPDYWSLEGFFGAVSPYAWFNEDSLYPIKEKTVTIAIKKIKLEPKKVLEKTEELLTAN